MNILKQKIIDRIRSEGPISFETFMDMCLYYPGLGYYMKESAKIGRAGDFYTSPHLHAIFGAMIGRQMEEMWEFMGKPRVFDVVEMGAGMGYLAKDMLDYLRSKEQRATKGTSLVTDACLSDRQEVKSRQYRDKIGTVHLPGGSFLDCLKYTVVEMNPAITAKQRDLLSSFKDKIKWVSNLAELEPVSGCFLSNELLDAFPVRMVENNDELMEIYVSVGEDDFVEIKKKPSSLELSEYFSSFGIELPNGYRTEVNLRLKEWIRDVSKKLSEGFVLTIDYGYPAWDYYGAGRSKGTLLCYYQHEVNEKPFRNVGEQDLTAHLNFSSLRRCGEEAGLRTIGFCPQGTYMVSLGIDELITDLYGDTPDAFEIAKIKGLILPQGMGESHKVIIQYKGKGEPKLRGFAIRNQEKLL